MIIHIQTHEEEWKDIIEYNVKDIYEISNYGRVRNKLTDKLIKPFVDKDGYLRCSLVAIYTRRRKFYVHRLVGYYFLPLKIFFNEKIIQINHKDTFKGNNYYKNLEWVTPKENIEHSWIKGLQHPSKGESHVYNKYSAKLIHDICNLLEKKYSTYEIKEELNMLSKNIQINMAYNGLIWKIKKRISWVHISKNYTF